MIKEEIIEMAEKVYGKCDWHGSALAHLEQFAKLLAEHEREACAKEAETTFYSIQAAENIRARGQE
jgi:hypothetical protein